MSLSQFSHVNICCSDCSSTATFQTLKQRFMQALENSKCPNNRAGGCYWQVMVFRLCGWWCSIHICILSISAMSTSKWNIKEPSVWSNHVTSQLHIWEHVFQKWNLHSCAWTEWTKLNLVTSGTCVWHHYPDALFPFHIENDVRCSMICFDIQYMYNLNIDIDV